MQALLERLEEIPILILMESGIPRTRIGKIKSWGNIELWSEKWDDKAYGGSGDLRVQTYTNRSGDHIDVKSRGRRSGLVRALAKDGVEAEKSHPSHAACSIGKGKDGRWRGWSHRAICSFGAGDMIFEPRFGDDETPFKKHGSKPIETDADAKLSAKRFARYVS